MNDPTSSVIQETAADADGGERQHQLPSWMKELAEYYKAEIAHQYILHDNINDLILSEGAYENAESYVPLRDYLTWILKERAGIKIVLFYSRAAGFTTKDKETAELLNGHVQLSHEAIVEKFNPKKCEPVPVRQAFIFIDQLLRQKEHTAAIILDHLEKLAPCGGGPSDDENANIEALRRWALDPSIQDETTNLLIGLTDNIERVSGELYATDSRCRPIQVPLPTEEERRSFLDILGARFTGEHAVDIEPDLDKLASQTKGFMLAHLDQLFRHACQSGNPVTLDMVKALKREIIKSESGELLEEKEPRHGFESIGGHSRIKDYLEKVTGYLSSGNNTLVPKGILLAGPPGTGKTLFAEALAKETGRNVVKMGDIRAKWVGESERNLSKVLQIIKDVAPVIVFVDEIDQALGSRGTGQSGDSGTSGRMFGRILEVMGSNEYRGKIIWVAATNRADVLDEAMIRRFDRVFPVLIPSSPQERLAIALAMQHQVDGLTYDQSTMEGLKKFSGDNANKESSQMTAEEGEDMSHPVLEFGRKTKGLTGSDLEIIIRRAKELAEDENKGGSVSSAHLIKALDTFKSNHHEDMYDLQTLLAVSVCNFVDVIPDPKDFPERLRGVIELVLRDKNNIAIEERVAELKQRLSRKKIA